MCSGICPLSSAARRRIFTLSFMCFCPIYSSQRVGRRVWSRTTSSVFFSSFFLDIILILCYTNPVAHLYTHYAQGYTHYSICVVLHIVKCIYIEKALISKQSAQKVIHVCIGRSGRIYPFWGYPLIICYSRGPALKGLFRD